MSPTWTMHIISSGKVYISYPSFSLFLWTAWHVQQRLISISLLLLRIFFLCVIQHSSWQWRQQQSLSIMMTSFAGKSLLYSEFICYCCYYYLTMIIIITYVSRVFVATVLSFGIVERPQKKDVPLGATVNNTHNQTNITKDKTMYKVKYKKRKFNIDSTISCRLPSAD